MMRTIEILLVVIIILGAFVTVSIFAVLPSPREVSPVNLRRLSLTTLEMLNSKYDLSRAAFDFNGPHWGSLRRKRTDASGVSSRRISRESRLRSCPRLPEILLHFGTENTGTQQDMVQH